MTDRLKGVVVTFNNCVREDDAEPILNAIRMITGVQAVEPLISSAMTDEMMVRKGKQELFEEIVRCYQRQMGFQK